MLLRLILLQVLVKLFKFYDNYPKNILSVDETIKNPKSQQAQLEAQPPQMSMTGVNRGGKMNMGGMKVLQGRNGK